MPRHEQAAAYMAMGYAKSTGRTGVFTVVPGPGVLNAAAALCTAMGNCAPVVCLTGQVPSSFRRPRPRPSARARGPGGTLRTLIKDAWRIDSPTTHRGSSTRRFATRPAAAPGPIAVEMCWDTMAARGARRHRARRCAAAASRTSTRMPSTPRVRAAGVGQEAHDHVRRRRPARGRAKSQLLAETLQAPVTAFRSGRGVVPEDHPLGVASVAARELWDDVDVLVGVGSRLEMPYMRWGDSMRYERKPSHGPKLIRIDIDPAEMQRFEPDVAIVADSATACRLLAERLRTRVTPNRARVAEIAAAKRIGRSGVRAHPAADRRSCARSAPSCRATASSCPSYRRSASRPTRAPSRSWRRAPISRKGSRAHSASVFRRRSAPKWPIPTKPWCR